MPDTEDDSPTTFAWACATGGSLTAAQRNRIRKAIRSGYRVAVEGLVSWPLHRRVGTTAAFPVPPDSKLARTAQEAAADQGPALLGHGYRTWVLGAALAEHDHVTLDPELLYITALLHDAGLVEAVIGEDFTVRSGRILIDVGERSGEHDRGMRAADAAVAHATPGLAVTDDPVGFYVQAGAMADLVGLRMWDLPTGHLRRAYRDYPARGVHSEIPRLIRQEAGHVPDGRFALLRRSGLDLLVVASPTRLFAGAATEATPPV